MISFVVVFFRTNSWAVGEMRDSGSVKTEYVDAEDQQGEYSNDAENVSSKNAFVFDIDDR